MKILSIVILFFLSACATHVHDEGRQKYINEIEKFSAGDKQFAGIDYNFEFRATVLNHKITEAVHGRMNQMYAWSEQESSEKLNEKLAKLQNHTLLWLSFYTPERKNDNLATKRSIWKIYLVAGSQRYEGLVQKVNINLSEAKEIYPYHTRWATPYYVEFPVPTREIENEPLTLIITGPLGRREVSFPASPL